jgi:hypothetical protein
MTKIQNITISHETGSSATPQDCEFVRYPFDKYVITVKVGPNKEFLDVIEVQLNKEFLSYLQKRTPKGYHDVEEFYKE